MQKKAAPSSIEDEEYVSDATIEKWMQQLQNSSSPHSSCKTASDPITALISASSGSHSSSCESILQEMTAALKKDAKKNSTSEDEDEIGTLIGRLWATKGIGRTLLQHVRQGITHAAAVLNYLLCDSYNLSFLYSLVHQDKAFLVLNDTLIADPAENGEIVLILANSLIADRREMGNAALQSGIIDTMLRLMDDPTQLELPVLSRAGEFFANICLIQYSCERKCEERDTEYIENINAENTFLAENEEYLTSLVTEVIPVTDLANIVFEYLPTAVISETEIEAIATRVLTGATMKAATLHPMTNLFYACRLPERIFSWFEEDEEENEEEEEEDEEDEEKKHNEANVDEKAQQTNGEANVEGKTEVEDEEAEEKEEQREKRTDVGPFHLSKLMRSWTNSGYLPIWIEQIKFPHDEIHWSLARHIEIMCLLPSLPPGDDEQEMPAFHPVDALVEANVVSLLVEILPRCSIMAGFHILKSLTVIFQTDSSKHLLGLQGPQLNASVKALIDGVKQYLNNEFFGLDDLKRAMLTLQLCAVLVKAPVAILDKLVKHGFLTLVVGYCYADDETDDGGQCRNLAVDILEALFETGSDSKQSRHPYANPNYIKVCKSLLQGSDCLFKLPSSPGEVASVRYYQLLIKYFSHEPLVAALAAEVKARPPPQKKARRASKLAEGDEETPNKKLKSSASSSINAKKKQTAHCSSLSRF